MSQAHHAVGCARRRDGVDSEPESGAPLRPGATCLVRATSSTQLIGRRWCAGEVEHTPELGPVAHTLRVSPGVSLGVRPLRSSAVTGAFIPTDEPVFVILRACAALIAGCGSGIGSATSASSCSASCAATISVSTTALPPTPLSSSSGSSAATIPATNAPHTRGCRRLTSELPGGCSGVTRAPTSMLLARSSGLGPCRNTAGFGT